MRILRPFQMLVLVVLITGAQSYAQAGLDSANRYTNSKPALSFKAGLMIQPAGEIRSDVLVDYLTTRSTVGPTFGLAFNFPILLFQRFPSDAVLDLGLTSLNYRTRLQVPGGVGVLTEDIDITQDQRLAGFETALKLIHPVKGVNTNGLELIGGLGMQGFLFHHSKIRQAISADIQTNNGRENRVILQWGSEELSGFRTIDTDIHLGVGYRFQLENHLWLAARIERVRNLTGSELVRSFEMVDLGIEYRGEHSSTTDHWKLSLVVLPF